MGNNKKSTEREGLLVKLSTFFVERWKAGLVIWAAILIGGAFVYTSVIPREGFPPISFPLSVVTGTYNVDDSEKVDAEVALPISDALTEIDAITNVQTVAGDNFFSVQVNFDDTQTSATGTSLVEQTIQDNTTLPEGARYELIAIDPGGVLLEYDMLVHVYATNDSTALEIDAAATSVAAKIAELSAVEAADAKTNVVSVLDQEGESVDFQRNFNRVGVLESGQTNFYPATVIGVSKTSETDIIALSEAVNARILEADIAESDESIQAIVSADFAVNINSQINFLENNILTGLIAVSFISLVLITWRASIITALFMVTVMMLTIIVLYFVGYTLNTITLFALILSLGLFVDDATIVVEAIDVGKRKKKASDRAIVAQSVKRVGAASFAGTLTTVLVFAILATPTGILGEFIRLIPITVIIALVLSYILSITLIPLLAKFIMLKDREVSWITKHNPMITFEGWASERMQQNIASVRTTGGKVRGVLAILLSVVMVVTGMYFFGFKVDNNTFPPSKDSDQIAIETNYLPGTTIEGAEEVSEEIEEIVMDVVGDDFVQAIYGQDSLANTRGSLAVVTLTPFTDRDVKAPEIVTMLQEAFDARGAELGVATIRSAQIDNGPPASQFPFGIRISGDDTEALRVATEAIASELVGQELESLNGTQIVVTGSQIEGVDGQILRDEGDRYAIARFSFDNSNSTLVTMLSEERFEEIFTDDKLSGLGITTDNVSFDAGQEGDFQDSFGTLLIAIPVALLLMYILLAVQFRSLLQPLLILLAIPFTLFGVGVGLYATNNAASFFALTGFIGLIGIAVNNTIMMTDYANQERKEGKGPIDAISNAAYKRFRPLVATSVTTVAALLPLALTDPFWEALAFTIIFGLISSTVLVLIAFPYYYLLLEAVRMWLRRVGAYIMRHLRKKTA